MRVRRPWISCAQRNKLWARWRAGESLTDIGKALQRGPARVYEIVVAEGGMAPAPRQRLPLALMTTDHEEISRELAGGVHGRDPHPDVLLRLAEPVATPLK